MRARIESITRTVQSTPRLPRRFRPRAARSTFVPVRDESIVRGLRVA